MVLKKSIWLASVVIACGAVQANEAKTIYVQGGWGENTAGSAVLGATLPWENWSLSLGSGSLRGQWDAYAGIWSSQLEDASRRNIWVIGFGPSLRWRGSEGQSPWFGEVGTSLHLSSRMYRSGNVDFSTRYNFASHIGVGRNFGVNRQHEISLRLQHTSNASIKRPNPGQNFVLFRYAHKF
ncbi:acyloxyacyl hydrolase [Comamonas sp. Y33R10-2]|uniref:acyloxyacyl hydrolase n=1 Tax=Comamonas sp. Y33R10-2 TaxID=2853257 RepID=UPI002107BB4F|nr:acyloxyacyl hydrolase [Comamonas sp. Y33R10-2]